MMNRKLTLKWSEALVACANREEMVADALQTVEERTILRLRDILMREFPEKRLDIAKVMTREMNLVLDHQQNT